MNILVYEIDPLTDGRWDTFAYFHPSASVFHSAGWLRALHLTYGYGPVAYTLSPPHSELKNAVVFCRVHTWATGRRLVSLPFADHCEPLTDNAEELADIFSYVSRCSERDGLTRIEVRPFRANLDVVQSRLGFGVQQTYLAHRVDLRFSCDDLMRSFHKSCIQRKIRRAERECLEYKDGRSEELLWVFFELLVKTRHKHKLPPQPIEWFRNLIECLGSRIRIHVALKDDVPVAAIVTLAWKDTLVYKYGCSDPRFNNLGGTPMLFWRAIQAAKNAGLRWFDLGRSDSDNPTLVAFKEHWGATQSSLSYWCYPAPAAHALDHDWKKWLAGQVFQRMPDRLLVKAGRLLYRHMG